MNKAIPATGLVYELVDLHDAITRKYRLALIHPYGLAGDMKAIFKRIAEESRRCRNQLAKTLSEYSELMPEQSNEANMLQTVVATSDRKTILAYCARDVKQILDEYARVIADRTMKQEWRELINRQYDELINLYAHIRQLHGAQ